MNENPQIYLAVTQAQRQFVADGDLNLFALLISVVRESGAPDITQLEAAFNAAKAAHSGAQLAQVGQGGAQ